MNKFLSAFFVLMYALFCSLGANRFSVDVWLFGGCHGFGITGYLRAPDTMAPKSCMAVSGLFCWIWSCHSFCL